MRKKNKGKYLLPDTCPLMAFSETFVSYSTAACAAARRAMGTRKGEQLT